MARVGAHHPRTIALGQPVTHALIVWSANVTAPRQIDVLHLGVPHVVCCYEQDDVLVDPGPGSALETLLGAIEEPPRRILLTHIHLDHAGATGALVRRWPELEVWVHERGAPHMADPSRLMASATRLYGDDMDRLWGEMVPIPEHNLRVLRGGERIGPWRVEYTPGHAVHHVSYLHEPTGTAFVGDTGGVRVQGGPVMPPTPPPDIDREAWHASLELIEGWSPDRLAVTHFGAYEDVGDQLRAMHEGLDRWSEFARTTDGDTYEATLTEQMRAMPDSDGIASFMQAMPPDVQWAGWNRYWSKRQAA
jgi:glyoxylase-like metal-dependent hydrolase (beta-lactamase superfamily II)